MCNSSVSKMFVLQTWDLYSIKTLVTIISTCNLSAGAAEKGRFYRACWLAKLAYLVGSSTERQLVSLNNVHITWGIISQAILQFPNAHIHMYTTQHNKTHKKIRKFSIYNHMNKLMLYYIILGKINQVHTHTNIPTYFKIRFLSYEESWWLNSQKQEVEWESAGVGPWKERGDGVLVSFSVRYCEKHCDTLKLWRLCFIFQVTFCHWGRLGQELKARTWR